MKMKVVVVEPKEFKDWLKKEKKVFATAGNQDGAIMASAGLK